MKSTTNSITQIEEDFFSKEIQKQYEFPLLSMISLVCAERLQVKLLYYLYSDLQSNVDVFFDEAVNKRDMSLEQFADIIATLATERYGIEEKGSISIGKDADIVLIDPDATHTLEVEDLEYRNKITPYLNREVGAKVVATYVRGNEVYSLENGVTEEFVGEYK